MSQLIEHDETFLLSKPLAPEAKTLIDNALDFGAMTVTQVVREMGVEHTSLEIRLHARLSISDMFDFLSLIDSMRTLQAQQAVAGSKSAKRQTIAASGVLAYADAPEPLTRAAAS